MRLSVHAPAWCALLALIAIHAGGAATAFAQVSPGPLAQAHADLDGALQCFNCHPRPGTRESMDERCIACHQEIGAMRADKRGFHARVPDRKCASCHPDHAGRDFHLIAWEGGDPKAFDHRRAGWALEGAHQKVECRSCHRPELQASPVASKLKVSDRKESWLALEPRCATCHEDEHRGQLADDCATCHTVAAWTPATGFDHAATRYPLTGKHAELKCAKCHPAEDDAAAPPKRGREGLVSAHEPGAAVTTTRFKPITHTECTPCHRDPHNGGFGAACAKCHTTGDFHTIREKSFDHSLTRYPLRGRHATVACASCHDPKLAWGKRPAFGTCDACHKDAHAGQATLAGRKQDCAACHDVENFRPSTFTVALHQKSAYPLAGAHANAECQKCHTRGAGTAATLGTARVALRPAHAACVDCHGDPHQGRLTRPAGGREPGCLDCHDMRRFTPSSVDVAAHQRYGFVLEGAHRSVPCQACHAELRAAPAASTLRSAQGRPLTFREPKTRCADCHVTPHGKQFDGNRGGGACENCHDLETFKPATKFDHTRDAAFRLEGAHMRVACASCHKSEAGPNGPVVIWKPVASRCESCHSGGDSTLTTRLQAAPVAPAKTVAPSGRAAAPEPGSKARPKPAATRALPPPATVILAKPPAPSAAETKKAAAKPASDAKPKPAAANKVKPPAASAPDTVKAAAAKPAKGAKRKPVAAVKAQPPVASAPDTVNAAAAKPANDTKPKPVAAARLEPPVVPAEAVHEFALDAGLFRRGAGAGAEWPGELRPLVKSARRRSDRAAAQNSAAQFDQAAGEWEQVMARAGGGVPAMEARYHAAEARYQAWRLDPSRRRAQVGIETLTSFLARAPQGAARDSAARWADLLQR